MFVGSRTLATRLDSAPDPDIILDYARRALERPSDAYFRDDTLYVTHTLGFYSAPGSDDTIAQSNYRTILEDLSTAYRRYGYVSSEGVWEPAVESASIGHWTYSHFDCIRIQVLYSNGEIHPAFADAVAIWQALESYPLYSEDDHSELEWANWESYLEEEVAYRYDPEYRSENLPEISDSDWDLFTSDIREAIGEKYGYYGESYASDEDWASAEEVATALVGSVRPDASFQTLPGL